MVHDLLHDFRIYNIYITNMVLCIAYVYFEGQNK